MRIFVMALLTVAVHVQAAAQELRLEIHAGRVTLDARDVAVERILAQWEIVGGTAILGKEQIASPPVTLRLEVVTERDALEAILRGVPGFVAQQRARLQPHVSIYERIVILARSAAPAPAAPFVPQPAAVDPSLVSFSPETAAPNPTGTVGTAAGAAYHAPLPSRPPALPAGEDVLIQGRTGRRAEPGMVPAVVTPPAAAQPRKR